MKHNIHSYKIIRHITISLGVIAFFTLATAFLTGIPKKSSLEAIKAESLNSPPSISPLDVNSVTMTSGYGMRIHPISKTKQMHKGIDLAAPLGTDVYATANGKVIETGYKPKGSGRFILIDHGDHYESFYAQLDEVLVETGDEVVQGSIIGKVGSSGLSTGPHLHYEVRVGGEAVDPADYLP